MAVYNYAGGEINIKIVYYGPGLSGKTTNLEHMYSKLPRENKGKMVSMKTRTDRTLFFDFLPIEVGGMNGMTVRFLLYTVPGQVYYNATRKLVLRGVDAVVFVADTECGRMEDNQESLNNLEDNLNELGLSLAEIPWVIQYNKRDVSGCMSIEDLQAQLNTWNAQYFEAVATTGEGVYETFEGIARKVFRVLKSDMKDSGVRSEEPGEDRSEKISVEVVAQGKVRQQDSEADESESLGYAEEREEEHESVSDFVDNVLSEGELEGSIDMKSSAGGYEEYGHVVELGEKEEEVSGEETTAEDPVVVSTMEMPESSEDGEGDDPDDEALQLINDPLEKLTDSSVEAEVVSADIDSAGDDGLFEKVVRVPVELSEEEIRNKIPLKVLIDITVT